MDMYLNGKWQGAAWEYCEDEQSFISRRIVNRLDLELKGDRIQLTWKRADLPETHSTLFIVHDNISADFFLGTKCCDDAYNRDEVGSSANKGRKRTASKLELCK